MPSWSDIGLAVANPMVGLNAMGAREAGLIGEGVNPMNWWEEGQDDAAAQQRELLRSLQESAAGRGPSVADAQMRMGLDRLQNQGAAAAASARGMSPAAAQRMALLGQMRAGTQASGMGAVARAGEQTQARAQLAAALAQYREQEAARQKSKWDRLTGLVGSVGSAMAGVPAGIGGGGGQPQQTMMSRGYQPSLAGGGLMDPFTGQMTGGTRQTVDPENPYARRRY